jgi:hypothetical protein
MSGIEFYLFGFYLLGAISTWLFLVFVILRHDPRAFGMADEAGMTVACTIFWPFTIGVLLLAALCAFTERVLK